MRQQTSIQRRSLDRRTGAAPASAGFTLVEMLVATGLVVLMLLFFAQIFGAAVGTMRNQRGIGVNDAKARTIGGQLRYDLQRMTYRQAATSGSAGIVPLSPGDSPVLGRQEGFFYYSENDPEDDTDDVLHFTIQQIGESTPLIGRAAELPVDPAPPGTFNDRRAAFINQPDADDGVSIAASGVGNGLGQSKGAEVCYFLRDGVLYRRMLLLRDPLPQRNLKPDPQPTFPITPPTPADPFPPEAEYFDRQAGFYTTGSGNFYTDFDYSAFLRWNDLDFDGLLGDPASTPDEYRLTFNSLESLQNYAVPGSHPIAIPSHRFGFSLTGQPREYAGTTFFGRFKHGQTSDATFRWPGVLDPSNYGLAAAAADIPVNPGGTVPFPTGPRMAEDIVLTNVEAFDVKVYDPAYIEIDGPDGNTIFTPFQADEDFNQNGVQENGGFVDLGNNYGFAVFGVGIGHYTASARVNPFFGPAGSDPANPTAPFGNNVFDTWHPAIDMNGDTVFENPPFQPRAGNSPLAATNDVTAWGPRYMLPVGAMFFPDWGEDLNGPGAAPDSGDPTGAIPAFAYEDADDDRVMDLGEDVNGNGRLDPDWDTDGNGRLDGGQESNTFAYQVIQGGITGPGPAAPEWPRIPGYQFQELGDDLNGNGVIDDDEVDYGPAGPTPGVIWRCIDNRVGLQAVQITIRFRDVQTNLPRQLTIQHSFVE